MDRQKYITEKQKTYRKIETEIQSKVDSAKTETERAIELLRKRAQNAIENIEEELHKDYNAINRVYIELDNQVNRFRSGTYSRYFSKLQTDRQNNRKVDAERMIKEIRAALEVLSQYENAAIRKFFVETFTKKITKTCLLILNCMQQLKIYVDGRKKEAEDQTEERTKQIREKLLADEQKEWDAGWKRIQELIGHRIRLALSEIGE